MLFTTKPHLRLAGVTIFRDFAHRFCSFCRIPARRFAKPACKPGGRCPLAPAAPKPGLRPAAAAPPQQRPGSRSPPATSRRGPGKDLPLLTAARSPAEKQKRRPVPFRAAPSSFFLIPCQAGAADIVPYSFPGRQPPAPGCRWPPACPLCRLPRGPYPVYSPPF